MPPESGQHPTSLRNNPPPALVVALDLPTASEALTLAENLRSLPLWLKVGLELFTASGPDLLKSLRSMRLPLFLDLKFHDIPNTVRGAIRSAITTGARMATLHLCGGEAMCRAAVSARNEAKEHSACNAEDGLLLMGVTVLTSQAGREEDIRSLVVERALAAKAWGLDGVVCSGWESAAVKAACGPEFLCLCPGIRFEGPAATGRDDQARICTPEQAVAAGADFLVMGRPITGAAHPAEAAQAALDSMRR